MNSWRYIEVKQFGQASRIPIILPDLLRELNRVEPSDGKWPGEYRACQVELNDGSMRDRVYVIEAVTYISRWGVWPEADPGKASVSLHYVKHIESSPTRPPASLANKLNEAGETSMGGTTFGLVLRDGRTIPAMTGNAVDFLEYAPGVSASDVVDVAHGWKDPSQRVVPSARYYWCLYCLEPDQTRAIADAIPGGRVTWSLLPS